MEETVLKALERTPDMLAIVVLVWMMFKFLEKMDSRWQQRHSEFVDVVKDMHRECMEARAQSRQVIERNTVESTNNTNALREMAQAVRDYPRQK